MCLFTETALLQDFYSYNSKIGLIGLQKKNEPQGEKTGLVCFRAVLT